MIRFRSCIFGRNITYVVPVFFLLHPIRKHPVVTCPITNDVHFDHLIKVVSARQCEITDLMGRNFETI